jgi:hypothetical protein
MVVLRVMSQSFSFNGIIELKSKIYSINSESNKRKRLFFDVFEFNVHDFILNDVLNVGPNHDGSTTVELLGFGDSEIKN